MISMPSESWLNLLWSTGTLPLLQWVQAVISRIRLQQGKRSSCTRLPITMHILGRMREALAASSGTNNVVVWAVALYRFAFFHLGELLQIILQLILLQS